MASGDGKKVRQWDNPKGGGVGKIGLNADKLYS